MCTLRFVSVEYERMEKMPKIRFAFELASTKRKTCTHDEKKKRNETKRTAQHMDARIYAGKWYAKEKPEHLPTIR